MNSATLLGASSSEVDSCGGGDNWILPMADFNFPMAAFPPTRWTWIFDSLAEKNFLVLPFLALCFTTGFPCLIREFGPPEIFFWVVIWHVVMASVMLSLDYCETSNGRVLTGLSTTYFAVKYTFFSGVLRDNRRGINGKISESNSNGSGASVQCLRCLPTCQARKVNFISNSSLFFCLVTLLGLIGSFLSCIHFEMEPLGRRVSSRYPNPLFFLDYTESLGPLWNVDEGKDKLITNASDMLAHVYYETSNGRVLTGLSTTYFAVKYTFFSGWSIDSWASMEEKIPKPSYLRSRYAILTLSFSLGLLHIPNISCSLVVVNIHEERRCERDGMLTGVEERSRFLGSIDLFQIASAQLVTKWTSWYQQKQVKCRNWFLPNLRNWNLYFALVDVYFL